MDRRLKTHPKQWTALLDFAEKNPVVLTRKIEGPFGKERYERLWDELTTILNSLGYLQKSKEKWQKAVADWKSKTRAKAADIKIQLTKTGGGGQGRQLSEHEKRLIGITGWTSIRGDGTIELGAIQPSDALSDLQEMASSSKSNQFIEHNYSFQIEPTPITENKVPSSVPSKFEKKSVKMKKSPKSSKWKACPTNLEKMHAETLNVLGEINTNVKNLADSQNRMCTLHEQFLEYLLKN